MNFQLNNPPVAEVWIQARYAPPADGGPWDWHEAFLYLDTFDELTIRESLPSYIPTVTRQGEGELPAEFEITVVPRFARARTESRSRIVQVGENELLVSHVREGENDYPGFTPLKELFLEAHKRFRASFNPADVQTLELHYVDIVAIQAVEGQVFELHDLFEGAPDLPLEPFGNALSASWSFGFVDEETRDYGELAVRLLPPEPGFLRFRLDWHRTCVGFDASDEGIAQRLIQAHNYLKRCFRAICKPTVWQSFEPT